MKRKLLFLSMMLFSVIGAFAQSSLETALEMQVGDNSSAAYEVSYYKGAYFKYHAEETCVLTVSGKSLSFSFFNADAEENYDYYSEDKGSNYSYSIKVEAGTDMYVLARLGYGADGNTVNFNASVTTGVFEHGMSADDAIAVEDGNKYWFEGGESYMTYTATADGVLQLNVKFYPSEATYTVDGEKTYMSRDDDDNLNVPVKAGKAYSIYIRSYSSLYPVSVTFTQPQVGDTKENPFQLVLGDNRLPGAAQKYYYTYTNGDNEGFLTVSGDGIISARDIDYSYDNLARDEANSIQILLQPDQEILITVEKVIATVEDEVLVASFATPQPGDLESTAIALTSSESAVVESPVGTKYYVITNPASAAQFLNVAVDTEGIDSYSNSVVKVYKEGENPAWYGTYVSSGSVEKLQVAAGATYYVRVVNKEEGAIKFRAWFEEIAEGDVYANPIALHAGDNTVAAGQKFYCYTPHTSCKLTVTVNLDKATVFFPNYEGDEYYGRDLISSGDGEYVLAAEAGQTYIMRVTASEATTLNVTEVAYGAGASRDTALPIDGTYEFDDLAPYNVWLVYEAPRGGVAEISCTGIDDVTYYDNIDVYLNDATYGSNLRGYDDSYNTIMKNVCMSVAEGDKLYIHIDVAAYAEGAQLSVIVRDANPGEAASNPIVLTTGAENPNTLPYVGYSDEPVWYTFSVATAGDVTFTASEYISASLYDANMTQVKAGEYGYDMYTGGYYEPVTLTLAAGTYYLTINSNSSESNVLTLSGDVFDSATAIAEVESANAASAARYNLAGQRVGAGAKGLIIVNGKKVVKK